MKELEMMIQRWCITEKKKFIDWGMEWKECWFENKMPREVLNVLNSKKIRPTPKYSGYTVLHATD